MGSSYFGEPSMGNERSVGGGYNHNHSSSSNSSSSSSSRKGKKNNSDKPKQPQRGLGVAQLEKIRLHGQMACGFHPSLHPPPFPNSTFNNNDDPRLQIAAYSPVPSSSFSYSSSSTSNYAPSYAFHPNVVMGVPDQYETTNIRYGDSQPRWDHSNAILESQSFAQPNVTRPFLNLYDSQHRSGSSSQNSESSDNQELDLELRLSL